MAISEASHGSNWAPESTPTSTDYWHKVIKTQFIAVARTSKNEQELRDALIACNELMIIVGEARLNAISDEPGNTFYHRQLTTVLNHIKQAKGALRIALAGVRKDQKIQTALDKSGSKDINMSPEAFRLFMTAFKSVEALKPRANTNNGTTVLNSVEEDIAASAIGRLKQRLASGETLEQIANDDKAKVVDDSKELLGALKTTVEIMAEDKGPSVEELFKPDENGEVEL